MKTLYTETSENSQDYVQTPQRKCMFMNFFGFSTTIGPNSKPGDLRGREVVTTKVMTYSIWREKGQYGQERF